MYGNINLTLFLTTAPVSGICFDWHRSFLQLTLLFQKILMFFADWYFCSRTSNFKTISHVFSNIKGYRRRAEG